RGRGGAPALAGFRHPREDEPARGAISKSPRRARRALLLLREPRSLPAARGEGAGRAPPFAVPGDAARVPLSPRVGSVRRAGGRPLPPHAPAPRRAGQLPLPARA